MKPSDAATTLEKILAAREATIRNLRRRLASDEIGPLSAPTASGGAANHGLPTPDLHGQELELGVLARVIPHVKQRTFLDIGAEQGALSRFFMAAGLTGHLFEPFTPHAPALKALVKGTSNVFHPLAIDERDHRAKLYLATDHAGAPISEFNSLQKFSGKDARISQHRTQPVECRSLRSLIADGSIPTAVGVVKTDTEGNDAAVLRGMPAQYCEVLCCEYFTEGLYAGWEQSHPRGLLELARQLGFEHYVAVKHRADVSSVMLGPAAFVPQTWGNLIFVRPHLWNACLPALLELIRKSDQAVDAKQEALRQECALLARSNEERLALIQELSRALEQIRGQLEAKNAAQMSALGDLKAKDAEIGRLHKSLRDSQTLADNLRRQVEAKEQSQVAALRDLKAKDAEIGRLYKAVEQLRRQTGEKEIALRESQKLAAALNRQLGEKERAVLRSSVEMKAKEKIIQELKSVCNEREALIERLSASR